MEPLEVLEMVKGNLKGCTELALEAAVFRGSRRDSSGDEVEVVIRVFDSGPSEGALRWRVEAQDQEGRMATGHSDADLGVALAGVHWQDLDRETEN